MLINAYDYKLVENTFVHEVEKVSYQEFLHCNGIVQNDGRIKSVDFDVVILNMKLLSKKLKTSKIIDFKYDDEIIKIDITELTELQKYINYYECELNKEERQKYLREVLGMNATLIEKQLDYELMRSFLKYEGREEGRQEGRQEGMLEKSAKVFIKALKKGFDLKEAKDLADVSDEELKELEKAKLIDLSAYINQSDIIENADRNNYDDEEIEDRSPFYNPFLDGVIKNDEDEGMKLKM